MLGAYGLAARYLVHLCTHPRQYFGVLVQQIEGPARAYGGRFGARPQVYYHLVAQLLVAHARGGRRAVRPLSQARAGRHGSLLR